jgi:ssDNA-binding Zn-finger/Zn-ribbon topoisomerase 1
MLDKAIELTVGAWVYYEPIAAYREYGRIKSWNDHGVFVVFHCDNQWDRFEDYTGCLTDFDKLTLVDGIHVDDKPCPFCGKPVFLRDSSIIYNGKSYGSAWVCSGFPKCDSYVNCHPGSIKSLGKLSDKETRIWRQKAHAAFDPIWKARLQRNKHRPGYHIGMARGSRYKKLARLMGLKECHIGEMNKKQCKKVIKICESGGLD